MDFRTLIDRNTPLSAVYPEYIAPRIQKPASTEQTKPTKQQQDDEATTQKVRFFFILAGMGLALLLLATVGWTPGGFIATGLWLAFVFAPKRVTVTLNAYVLWMLSHLPGAGILAGLTVAFFAGSLLYGSATGRHIDPAMILLALLCAVLFLLAVVGGVLNLIVGTANVEDTATEPVELTAADRIRELLPMKLVDYYAPMSDFRRSAPLRSHYDGEEAWQAAVSEQNELVWQERVAHAESFILDVTEDEASPGVVLASLAVRNGGTDKELVALAPVLDSQLNAYGVSNFDFDARSGFVGFRINTVELPTAMKRIESVKTPTDFFTSNPSGRLTSYTAGVDTDDDLTCLPLSHTLVLGATGAGKGSIFRAITAHIAPYIEQGTVRAYVIDPKNGEAKAFRKAKSLFTRIEHKSEAMADVVDEVYELLKTRQEMEDEWDVSPENPVVLLFVDELLSLRKDTVFIKRKDEELNGMTTDQKLVQILAQGRSDRVFVVAATQNATKAELGNLRDNFTVRILLRVENITSAADYFLGVDSESVEVIAPSTEDNGYRTAGIGYIRLEGREGATLMRFGFMDNQAFKELGDEYNHLTLTQNEAPELHRKVETQPVEERGTGTREAYLASLLAQLEDDED